MIRSKLKWLRLRKEEEDGRKLSYRVIAQESGVSVGAVVRLMGSEFTGVERATLNALCAYFDCTVGEILEYVPDKEKSP